MKLISKLVALLFLFLCSCGLFAAGSFPYAEGVYSSCERSQIIKSLQKLKEDAAYTNPYGISDGIRPSVPAYYIFYFLSKENNCVLVLAVGPGYDKDAAVLLVGVHERSEKFDLKLFNHDLSKERQQQITAWFNQKIKPAIMCN